MLVIRWLLSKLTFFIFFSILGYIIFNWYSKDSSLDLPVTSAINNPPGNEQLILKVKNTEPEEETISKQISNKSNVSNINKKIDSTDKTKSIRIVTSKNKKKVEEANIQHVEEPKIDLKKVIDKKEKKLIYPPDEHKVKHDSKPSPPIDELVSLLMSGNHLFDNTQSTELLSGSNEKPAKNNQIENKWKLARAYFSSKNYLRAEQEYLELIKLEPEFTDFYGELSNLYFVINEIKKYNIILTTLTRLYIKNKNINMARYIIGLLQKKSPDLAKMLEQELQYKYSEIIL
jgi:tetratricopeptide (TPR) repeat protein